jgi:YD repeat-containing protein
MKKYFQIVTLISLLLTPPKLRAEINMKDASYKISSIDIKEIRRTYNSRSIYAGIYGFGWCSNLEKSLNILSTQEIIFKDCDLESPFVLTDENNLLKTRLYQNSINKEKIFFKNGTYTHYLNNGEIRIFNRTGQILSLVTTDGKRTQFIYSRNTLSLVKSDWGDLRFYMNHTGQVTKIESSSGGVSAFYTYEKEKLIQSTDTDKNTTSYEYDSLNNIIKVIYPDKTEENIVYNNDYDRVLKIELRNHCLEYYDFYSKNKDPLYQVSTLTRKCDNKTIHQYIYEFWYKYRSDGLKYLERYKIDQKTRTLDITYNPYDGNPIRILKNGKIWIKNI